MHRRLAISLAAGAVGLAGLALAGVAGCGRHAARATDAAPVARAAPAPPVDPVSRLHEQLHAAAFQVGEALDHLSDAIADLKPVTKGESGDTKQALSDVLAAFDEAGGLIDDYSEAPETSDLKKQFASGPAGQEARRLKGVADINDAAQQILNAQGTLDDLIASGPPANIAQALKDANAAADEAEEALAEAVRQLGGNPVDDPAPR